MSALSIFLVILETLGMVAVALTFVFAAVMRHELMNRTVRVLLLVSLTMLFFVFLPSFLVHAKITDALLPLKDVAAELFLPLFFAFVILAWARRDFLVVEKLERQATKDKERFEQVVARAHEAIRQKVW